MKRTSLIASAAIILVANALALVHAMRNRTGTPEAEMALTQRELRYFNPSVADDDSGVTLHLEWTDPSSLGWPAPVENLPNWLDQQKLQSLGFDCSVNPASPDAGPYYRRQRPRQVFVALEYDGAAWQAWVEVYERAVAEQRAKTQSKNLADNGWYHSHLIAIDADLDPLKLRARYPNRSTVVILPAVVAVTLEPFPYPGMKLDPKRVRIRGRIQQLPSSIHVPRPFSDEFRRRNQQGVAWTKGPFYRVHLRYGAFLEPSITGVEFTNGQ